MTKMNAIDKAAAKGAKDALDLSRKWNIVNVPNRTVVTALDGQAMNDNVFTQIDSAMIMSQVYRARTVNGSLRVVERMKRLNQNDARQSHHYRRPIPMLRSMYSGVSGMRGFQTKLDVIGNNIANVNTIGFKRVVLCLKIFSAKQYPV